MRVSDYIPDVWCSLLQVKMLFYEAVADFSTATEQLGEVAETSHNKRAATWTGLCACVCVSLSLCASVQGGNTRTPD